MPQQPIYLMLDSNCLRCGVWFEGVSCPFCDRDTGSRPVDPPPWFEGETFRSHAWGVRVPLYEEEPMKECERCGAKPEGKYGLHDYCAQCFRDLCPKCMAKGCCGKIPADSGQAADAGDEAGA